MKKRIPRFWWDFWWKDERIFSIRVESDEPQYPVLAEFILDKNTKYADVEVDLAVKMIEDLEAGRLTLKKAFSDYEKSHKSNIL